MGSFRKTLLTFIDSWISGPKPKLTHIWHKDRHDSLDFSKQRPESQAKQTKTCRCAERSPVSEIQASLRQRSTGNGEVIPRISSRFKYVYSAKTSLQAATCFLLSRLHHEATAETKQITAACCSHSACTSLRLNSGLCTSVIYTCAATLC